MLADSKTPRGGLLSLEVLDDLRYRFARRADTAESVLPAGRVAAAEARDVLRRVRVDRARTMIVEKKEAAGCRTAEGRCVTTIRRLRAQILSDAAPES